MTVELSDPEMMRYNRQIVLRGFDFEGQEALKAASVLVVGVEPATPDAAQRRDGWSAESGICAHGAGAN